MTIFNYPCQFITSAFDAKGFSQTELPEISFIGRSNVGKSSLINALTNRRNLARTSRTPGRTQSINFFVIPDKISIADLPGYGFANVPLDFKAKWERCIYAYLQNRQNMRRLFILIDARRGIMPIDKSVCDILQNFKNGVFQFVLTKSDKVKKTELDKVIIDATLCAKSYPLCFPTVLVTSSTKKTGIDTLKQSIQESIQ